jgi:SPP1 gp7 family putative phage head morphogenesis protein
MATIYDVIDDQNAAIRKREEQTLKHLAREYSKILKVIQVEIDALANEMQLLIDQGTEPSISMQYRLERVNALQAQTRIQLRNYAIDTLRPSLIETTTDAVQLGQGHAQQLILKGISPPPSITLNLYGLPSQATNNLIATTNSGPLNRLLSTFGELESLKMRQSLTTGLATGKHPYAIARDLTRQANLSFKRAALISRTETLRAYRESHRQTYQANSHLVGSWIWHASMSTRTCATCIALHGTEHPLTESMASHPACRCSSVPKTKTWKELGFNVSDANETSYSTEPGSSVFAGWSTASQIKVMGPNAHAAYANGEVELQDFIRIQNSPSWGTTYTTSSLAQARQNAERRQRTTT